MKNYYLVRPGRAAVYAKECYDGNYIGVGFLGEIDLTNKLTDQLRDFNREMTPIWLAQNPTKTKVAAGLACGNLWVVAKGILLGDIVLCPQGSGSFAVGEVIGQYSYTEGADLPHQRSVRWLTTISKDAMSDGLQNTTGSIMTAFSLSKHAVEIEQLIGTKQTAITIADEAVEDPTVFALEKHLEDFLVHNWVHTELGKKYAIYEADGEIIGEQYPSDTGPIDILAISHDKSELLVVELKRGRISDVVVGQIQRYMGYVKEELAEKGQKVSGLIIALEDDIRLQRALSVTQNIEFMTYEVKFKLNKNNQSK